MRVTSLHPNLQFESSPQTIAVVRALPGLGDLLCAVPAFRALRAAFPDAEITLIGLPGAKGFVQRFSRYIDRWIEFPGFPGIPEVPLSATQVAKFLSQIQLSPFDLALQMHGNGSQINSFVLLLGAKNSAGFFPIGHFRPGEHWLPYPNQESEIWRLLRLLENLGIPLQGDSLEFPLQQSDWEEWDTLASVYSLNANHYICIHPGASVGERCWLPKHFANVADTFMAQGMQVVLTGTAAEAPLTRAVIEMMRFPALDLAGQTSLGGIAALLKNARLLICNDTGISHLAAALRVKSVVIFSNSDPQRWAPLDRQRHRIVGGYTAYSHSKNTTSACYPTPAVVLTEATDLLQQEIVYAT